MSFRFPTRSALMILIGLLVVALATGCTDETVTDTRDTGQPDDVVDDDTQDPDDATTDPEPDISDAEIDVFSCEPGEVVGCTEDQIRSYEHCNDAGTALEQTFCGDMEICKEGECIEAECLPGMNQCASPTVREICEIGEDGEPEYVEQPPCDDNLECVQGHCVDRCAQAEASASYIGCEYWAVEKENHLVHADLSLQGERPPFAVVLANTESQLPAEVTVHAPNGQIANAVGQRTVAPSQHFMGGTPPVTVYSETVDSNGQRIDGPHDGAIDAIELPPGSMLTLILPNQDIPFGQSTVTSTAYRVESTQPMVAYQFNPLCCNYNYTNDASLLVPTTSLTNRYMMIGHAVFGFAADAPYGPTLTVIGTEPNTHVTIQLPESLAASQSYAQRIYPPRPGDGIVGPDASGLMEVTLNEHEVFNLSTGATNPDGDLTGTMVEADADVAVFGGHTCTNVPTSQVACDHLEVQLLPLETWGNTFVAAPHKLRDPSNAADPNSLEGTYWKFVAREDGTIIDVGISVAHADVLATTNPHVPHCGDPQFGNEQANGIFELDQGQTCEFGTQEPFRAVGSNPFSITGFMSGQQTVDPNSSFGDHAGDPAQHLPPPQHQYRNSYTFLTPPTYHVSYITVIIPSGHNIVLDGDELDPTDYDHHLLQDYNLVVAHIEVEPGPHFVEADTGFGLVVYGYDDYVSYAYTGGLNLTRKYDF